MGFMCFVGHMPLTFRGSLKHDQAKSQVRFLVFLSILLRWKPFTKQWKLSLTPSWKMSRSQYSLPLSLARDGVTGRDNYLWFTKEASNEVEVPRSPCSHVRPYTVYIISEQAKSVTVYYLIKVGTRARGDCNKSQWQVPSPCPSKSSRRELWSVRLVPQILTSLKFWDKSLRLVSQNASFMFLGQVPCVCRRLVMITWGPHECPHFQFSTVTGGMKMAVLCCYVAPFWFGNLATMQCSSLVKWNFLVFCKIFLYSGKLKWFYSWFYDWREINYVNINRELTFF